MSLVSIIIPCYNQAQYMRKAIDSALAQTFFDFEVVVVNDGSTDETQEIAESYGARIKLITQHNQGLSATRNNGINASSGRFILPLDADDWIEPQYLERTVRWMDSSPLVGIVTTTMQRHGEINDIVPPRGLSLWQELRGNELPYCSLIRRKAWSQVGGYNTRLWSWEDWCLWLAILRNSWRVVAVYEPLFHYLVKKESMVTGTHGREKELRRLMSQIHVGLFKA